MAEVSVRNVRLSYGKIQALKDVSLEVEEGSLFGIIGPDGAGKTSLFRIMTTLIVPDSGSAHVCGYDTVKDMAEMCFFSMSLRRAWTPSAARSSGRCSHGSRPRA